MVEAYSELCQISKMMKRIKILAESEQYIQAFSGIFRDIQLY